MGSISFSCSSTLMLGIGISSVPSSSTVNVGTNAFFLEADAAVG